MANIPQHAIVAALAAGEGVSRDAVLRILKAAEAVWPHHHLAPGDVTAPRTDLLLLLGALAAAVDGEWHSRLKQAWAELHVAASRRTS